MADILKKPTVVDFLDTTLSSGALGLKLEEAAIQASSSIVGKSLLESSLRKDFGVMIVAIKKSAGEMLFNPGPDAVLGAGDVIVAIGKQKDLVRMAKILS